MSTNAETTQKNQEKRRKRQGKRVILQLFPMMIGLIGLYIISSWSMLLRLNAPATDTTPYYIGLALILLSLQLPVILEVNRRRTKKLAFSHVVGAFVLMTIALATAAALISPQLDMQIIEQLEQREWDRLTHDEHDDEGDEDKFDND